VNVGGCYQHCSTAAVACLFGVFVVLVCLETQRITIYSDARTNKRLKNAGRFACYRSIAVLSLNLEIICPKEVNSAHDALQDDFSEDIAAEEENAADLV
jgi:hypothetical protein